MQKLKLKDEIAALESAMQNAHWKWY
jgi:uncharacterized protein YdcH (DUF465 family)